MKLLRSALTAFRDLADAATLAALTGYLETAALAEPTARLAAVRAGRDALALRLATRTPTGPTP